MKGRAVAWQKQVGGRRVKLGKVMLGAGGQKDTDPKIALPLVSTSTILSDQTCWSQTISYHRLELQYHQTYTDLDTFGSVLALIVFRVNC